MGLDQDKIVVLTLIFFWSKCNEFLYICKAMILLNQPRSQGFSGKALGTRLLLNHYSSVKVLLDQFISVFDQCF